MASVLVLGGGGFVGSVAAEGLAPQVTSMTIADLDIKAARGVAEPLGAAAVDVDVTDTGSLSALIADHDLVVNSVGPCYRFGVPIMMAAIDAGVDYIDVCDDWEPTAQMLALNDRASAAGVIAVVGAGLSPGVSNMLVVAAMRRLDRVDAVYTIWPVFEDDLVSDPAVLEGSRPPGPSIVHWLHQLRGTIQVVENGQLCEVPALRPLTIEYPRAGPVPIWTCGHPEPITIPHHFPEVRTSLNAMATTKAVAELLRSVTSEADDRGLSAEDCADLFVARVRERGVPADPDVTRLPGLQSLAVGSLDGRSVSVGAAVELPDMHPSKATGIPLAVFGRLVLDGRSPRKGVFAPEGAFDADEFFSMLDPRWFGVPAIEEMEIQE